jgi:flagellar basal body-associated protein FliL
LVINQSDAVYLNSPNKEGDMDMDRRTWIAIAIAAVILVIGYVMYSRTGTVEPAKPSSTTTQPIAPAPAPKP